MRALIARLLAALAALLAWRRRRDPPPPVEPPVDPRRVEVPRSERAEGLVAALLLAAAGLALGFVAFYAELDYAAGDLPYYLSTQMRILGQ